MATLPNVERTLVSVYQTPVRVSRKSRLVPRRSHGICFIAEQIVRAVVELARDIEGLVSHESHRVLKHTLYIYRGTAGCPPIEQDRPRSRVTSDRSTMTTVLRGR